MSQLWNKIRGTWSGSIAFSLFLMIIFLGIFFLSNLNLDKNGLVHLGEVNEVSDLDINQRIGSAEFSTLDFNSWAVINNLDEGIDQYDADPDGDKLPNFLEYVHGTDPNNFDTDQDGFSDGQEIINGYDPDYPGGAREEVQISIEKINVSAPMVWSDTNQEKGMLKDLEKGVAHYLKTASPGQTGNSVISGHSSNFIWAAGNYNHIFADLNDLEAGDEITVKTAQKNGKVITYHYKITNKFITGPDDAEIFEETTEPTLTLSTCWPLGLNIKRLIVKAEMVK